jgi:MFS family permease
VQTSTQPTRTHPPRRGWGPIVALLIVQLLTGMVLSAQRYFFPIYVEETLQQTAVVVSAFAAGGQVAGMVAAVLGGTLHDTLGRKWTLMLGLLGFLIASFTVLVQPLPLVALLWALNGFGLGLYALGSQGYLIDVAGATQLGLVSALYHWGLTLGGALGSPGTGLLLDAQGFGGFGPVMIAFAGGTLLLGVLFLPNLQRKDRQKGPGFLDALRGYADVIRRPVVTRLALLRSLPTFYWGMATVLIPILINQVAASKTAVAIYATVSQVLASLAQMLFGRLADRHGGRLPTLLAFGTLVAAIFGQALFVRHLWSFYVFGVLGACAAWGISTLMPWLVADTTAPRLRGRILGTLHLVWSVGMMVGSLVGGALVEIGPGLPFYAAGLVNVGAFLVARAFFRK